MARVASGRLQDSRLEWALRGVRDNGSIMRNRSNRIAIGLTLWVWLSLLLTACATQYVGGVPASLPHAATQRYTQTFAYTGNEQSFSVPSNVKQLAVVVVGASGGKNGGKGGIVRATIPVKPGETLYVYVGGKGGRSPGYNGGAPGGGYSGRGHGWGGGGASDIREHGNGLSDRIVVAGGGGGGAGNAAGCSCAGVGGAGGGDVGAAGTNGNEASGGGGGGGGQGGSQDSGGQFGYGAAGYSCDGNFGLWGAEGVGGSGGNGGCGGTSGGGGGGGYYGGGGAGGGVYSGSNTDAGGGGGGGSSYVEPTATHFKNVQGKHAGNGQVTISW